MAEAGKFKSLVRTSLAIGEMDHSNPGQIKLASLAGMRRPNSMFVSFGCLSHVHLFKAAALIR